MVSTSSSSSDSSSSSSSDSSDCESDVVINEKEVNTTTQAFEKNAEEVDEKKSLDKKADSKITKRSRSKERKKQERKKQERKKRGGEKSVKILRKAISKQKEAQQKVNKKFALALKQVGIERRRQVAEINKLKKKKGT